MRFSQLLILWVMGLLFLFGSARPGLSGEPPSAPTLHASFMKGVDYCSWWNDDYLNEYSTRSIARVKEVGNDWISILVTWYQDDETATTISANASKSPSDDAIRKAIQDAKAQGLKVALKPHVDLNNGQWRGYIGQGLSDPEFTTFFTAWFTSYKL